MAVCDPDVRNFLFYVNIEARNGKVRRIKLAVVPRLKDQITGEILADKEVRALMVQLTREKVGPGERIILLQVKIGKKGILVTLPLAALF
jgi:hypothetical protein